MKNEQGSFLKKFLAAGVAAVALATGVVPESRAQQQAFPQAPFSNGIAGGLQDTAGYTCLPRGMISEGFNRMAIDSKVDMDFRMLPSAQNILALAAQKDIRICPDKALRRTGLGFGEMMLSPGALDNAGVNRRVARNEFLMAYELANFWLTEQGYSDRMIFQSQNDNQQYHAMREAATWALGANILHDLKQMYQQNDAWEYALKSPYRDIFAAYGAAYDANPSTEYQGIPHLRAFQQWFANPDRARQVMQDINWLQHGIGMQAQADPLTAQFLAGLGQRPEFGKPNFFSEAQNSLSIFPDRNPVPFQSPAPGYRGHPDLRSR